ncbi:MAG: IS1595 family transposase [Deltaproteobacteria bacterium]|nr:IS1595 family transposase [Deltaproteobacteria bacterium]
MNLITIFHRFPDQEACVEHLEKIRWGDKPECPHCKSERVGRKADSGRVGRWNCHACHASFNVLAGTIFQKTRMPLQKWFLAIGLIVNAKKSLSSCQLSRDLDINQPTALYMQHRIRSAMASGQGEMLQGIVEADETYVGGKPRKGNRHGKGGPGSIDNFMDPLPPKPKRGRGTSKTPVVGVVERGGAVRAKVATDLTGRGLLAFIKKHVTPEGSLLITDEYTAYNVMHKHIQHATINHATQYADGETHTNTIEGFWSLLKRAWHGSHHKYSKNWMPLYVAEACWKYNHREAVDGFSVFLRGCFA